MSLAKSTFAAAALSHCAPPTKPTKTKLNFFIRFSENLPFDAAFYREMRTPRPAKNRRVPPGISRLQVQERRRQIIRARHKPSALEHRRELAALPLPQSIQRCEKRVRRRRSLPAHEFAAAAHVVDQPRRQAKVIWVRCTSA